MKFEQPEPSEPQKKYTEEDYFYFLEHPQEATIDFTKEYPSFLNNFHGRFPVPEEFREKFYSPARGYSSEIFGEKFDPTIKYRDIYTAEDSLKTHSDIKLNQTKGEFNDALDKILYSICPDYDDLFRQAANEMIKEEGEKGYLFTIPRKFGDIYLEVYKRMRALGYSHEDLTV